MPGPPPKRSDQRIRRNKEPEGLAVTRLPVAMKVKIPNVSPKWHPLAKDWYRSLKTSGQAEFMENSDWQAARLVALQLTSLLNEAADNKRPIRATAFEAIWGAMSDLLTTEGARRRVRIELERSSGPVDPDAVGTVSVMNDYRQMFDDSS